MTPITRRILGGALTAVGALLFFATGAEAAPYVPKDDTVVLQRLPMKPGDAVGREIRELRARLAAQPDDLDAAVSLGRRYFRLAMAEGDPRFIGYAEAALRPWSGKNPPHDVLVLRAQLRQYRHDFTGALDDLAAAAASDAADPEVWLWRAAILLVQADYAGAASACDALRGTGQALDWIGCKTSVEAVTGRAAGAYAQLSDGLVRARSVRPGPRLWMLTRLAEYSLILDQPDRAERHFKEALALGVNDQSLLAAYADFLLDRGRPAEAVALLAGWTHSDALLLRLALAEKVTGAPALDEHVRALRARFDAAARRGDKLHQREEARFQLDLLGDRARALALARENWALQREPRDAGLLLEAAIAANDPAAARPAVEWLARSGYEDRRLRGLAAQLEAARR
jgi:thioredoxin-like negative regulator of GroEL